MNNHRDSLTRHYPKPKRTGVLKRTLLLLGLLSSIFPLIFSFALQDPPAGPGDLCRVMVMRNMEEMIRNLHASKDILTSPQTKNKKVKKLTGYYREARKHYKEIEFFIEYYSPFESKFFINGPLVPKVEMEISNEPFAPQGFQVIEEALFDEDKTDLEVLAREYDLLLEKLNFLKQHYSSIDIEQSKLQDALKLQIIRIMCLTLNGYDCTVNKESVTECAYAIGGMEKLLKGFKKTQARDNTLKYLARCRKQLLRHPDSDTFNRLDFMVTFLDPAYKSLLRFFEMLGADESPIFYAVNFKAGTFFFGFCRLKLHWVTQT